MLNRNVKIISLKIKAEKKKSDFVTSSTESELIFTRILEDTTP